jgi:hypothetical protein
MLDSGGLWGVHGVLAALRVSMQRIGMQWIWQEAYVANRQASGTAVIVTGGAMWCMSCSRHMPVMLTACSSPPRQRATLRAPHLTSPHLTSPHLTSPHLTSPHLTSPHLTSPSACLRACLVLQTYGLNQDMSDLELQLEQGKRRGRELQGRLAQLNNVRMQRLHKLCEKNQHRGVGQVGARAGSVSMGGPDTACDVLLCAGGAGAPCWAYRALGAGAGAGRCGRIAPRPRHQSTQLGPHADPAMPYCDMLCPTGTDSWCRRLPPLLLHSCTSG